MDFRLERLEDGYVDGLGNRFPIDDRDRMTLECELGLLEPCFSYSDYKRLHGLNNTNFDDSGLNKNDDIDVETDVDVDIVVSSKPKRGRYRYYSEGQRQRFWNMTLEEGYSAFRAAKLRSTFDDVKAGVSTIYKFITRKLKFSVKRISKWAMRRGLDDVKQQRYDWATEYKDKLDFNKNCVFIDEAGFNISMRREYGWSAVGEKAVIKVPVTKGVNVSFLGAICSKGCIDLKARSQSKTVANKKRKINSDTSVTESSGRGTTANHFYSFIKGVIQQIRADKDLKDLKYLILDNAAIHKRRDLQLLVALSGLELVFLPPYSPSLNAIEEFWSVCKSKVKRSALNRKEQLTPKVMEATSKIVEESYQGFCRHSGSHVQLCLDKQEF